MGQLRPWHCNDEGIFVIYTLGPDGCFLQSNILPNGFFKASYASLAHVGIVGARMFAPNKLALL